MTVTVGSLWRRPRQLRDAICGRGAGDITVGLRQSCIFPPLFLIQTLLLTVICARDLETGLMVEATLRGQLWELCEEPVTVFEETILMDCVKTVPKLICLVVVFLWEKR